MATLKISCPKCGTNNPLTIRQPVEGNRILCRRCDKHFTLTFTGRTTQKVVDSFRKELQKTLPKELKVSVHEED